MTLQRQIDALVAEEWPKCKAYLDRMNLTDAKYGDPPSPLASYIWEGWLQRARLEKGLR